ncbi:hypothetical protein ACROYT_G039334 [Oculina patagonica]
MNGFVRILSVAFLVARVSGQACIEETLDCNEPVPTIFKLGDQSCACNSAAHAGALKYANGKIYVCLGSKWKIVLLGDEYGTESNPGLSCKDILDKAGQQLSNGVFWIRLRGSRDGFPVYCDMDSGGWTMIFKAVTGANQLAQDAYKSADTYAEFEMDALDVTNKHPNDYKNRIVLNWGAFGPSEAWVALYKGGSAVKELKFNAQGSDKLNWFQFDKLDQATLPWNDLPTEPRNIFDIDPQYRRSFFINSAYGGCGNDDGWMVITGSDCAWETHHAQNAVIYSNQPGHTNWNQYGNVGVADTMVVYLR